MRLNQILLDWADVLESGKFNQYSGFTLYRVTQTNRRKKLEYSALGVFFRDFLRFVPFIESSAEDGEQVSCYFIDPQTHSMAQMSVEKCKEILDISEEDARELYVRIFYAVTKLETEHKKSFAEIAEYLRDQASP